MTEAVRIEAGSAYRYQKRRRRWLESGCSLPQLRHAHWWLLHNAIAHPILAVLPNRLWLHDWTSQRLNLRQNLRPSRKPEIPDRRKWVWHNVIVHLAIGLVPCRATFAYHDRTAEQMNIPDWV